MLRLRGAFGFELGQRDFHVPEGWHSVLGRHLQLQYESGHHSYVLHESKDCVWVAERYLMDVQPVDPAHRNGSWLELCWSGEDMVMTSDRIGTIPIHWAFRGGVIYFATRLSDVARLLPGGVEPDKTAVLTTIFLDHSWGYRTLLRGVQLLPPASRCHFRLSRPAPQCDRYWSPPAPPITAIGQTQDWLEAATEHLKSAHAMHTTGLDSATVAMPVTAGLDSRCNLALHPEFATKARLFHCHDLGNVEWPYACRIGRYLGRSIECFDSAEDMRSAPSFDADLGPGDFNIGHWRLVGTAKRLADSGSLSTVDGFLQDLLFKATFLRDTPREQQIEGHLARLRYNAAALGLTSGSDEVRLVSDCVREDFPVASSGLECSQLHYLENRSRRLVYNIVRLNQNYLDVRTPALDHTLMDFAFSLPWSLRKGSWLYRRIIHQLSPELAAIPYDKTGLPLLDPRPRSRAKEVIRHIRPILDRAWPGRTFLQRPEGNFSRLARQNNCFRDECWSIICQSEWLRDTLRLESFALSSYKMGHGLVDCMGGLLTIALLESRVKE